MSHLPQPQWLRREATLMEGIQSNVNGIICCLHAELKQNGDVPTDSMKETATLAITAGIGLERSQIDVISQILTADELIKIGDDLMKKYDLEATKREDEEK